MARVLVHRKKQLFMEVDDSDLEYVSQYKWYIRKDGYVRRQEKLNDRRIDITVHRDLLQVDKSIIVDHVNGNKLDNRRINLRQCNQAENVRNKRMSSNNTSGYKGVYWHKMNSSWIAEIWLNDEKHYLGSFSTKEEAARVYNEAAITLHGEFARLNEVKVK